MNLQHYQNILNIIELQKFVKRRILTKEELEAIFQKQKISKFDFMVRQGLSVAATSGFFALEMLQRFIGTKTEFTDDEYELITLSFDSVYASILEEETILWGDISFREKCGCDHKNEVIRITNEKLEMLNKIASDLTGIQYTFTGELK